MSRSFETLPRHLTRASTAASSPTFALSSPAHSISNDPPGGPTSGFPASSPAYERSDAALHTNPPPAVAWDYIIIGAGSAGCVLASRLSEDPSINVLLLEAGGTDNDVKSRWPVLYTKLQLSPLDWQFKTKRQAGQYGRRQNWPRGKLLGGSSSINAMLWVRGDPAVYDFWERERGCEGWSWASCLPYFRKAEGLSNTKGGFGAGSPVRSTSGPLEITSQQDARGKRDPDAHPFSHAFVQGCADAGVCDVSMDINGENPFGATMPEQTITENGLRASTARAYLRRRGMDAVPSVPDQAARATAPRARRLSALNRPNLAVVVGIRVTRLVMQGERCVGVLYRSGGNCESDAYVGVRSSCVREGSGNAVMDVAGEVLVCCGAVQSPQLLMLSGIGPRSELERHGIEVVAALESVGQNLQDHLFVPLPWKAKKDHPLAFNTQSIIAKMSTLVNYALTGGGLGRHSAIGAMSFSNTGVPRRWDGEGRASRGDDFAVSCVGATAAPGETRPRVDLQIHFSPALGNGTENLNAFGFDGSVASFYDEAVSLALPPGVTFLPTLLLPRSRGVIALDSADPLAAPAVDPRYLSDPEGHDVAVLKEGIRLCRRVARSKAFASILQYDGEIIDETPLDHTHACHHAGGAGAVGSENFCIPTHQRGGGGLHKTGRDSLDPESDEYLEGFVRRSASTVYHPVGTVAMGPRADPRSCVDVQLRVHGIAGLRVVDASCFPTITAGNTNAPTIMLAEKAADMILGARRETLKRQVRSSL